MSRAVAPAGCAEAVGAVQSPWVASHRRRRPLAWPAPRWACSSSRHAPKRPRLEPGDPSSAEIAKKVGRKVCAQLCRSIPLISEGLLLHSPDRLPQRRCSPP